MNIQVGKTNGRTMYDYGTISSTITPAQLHYIMRELYPHICEEFRFTDLTFRVGDYIVRMRSVKVSQKDAEAVFRDIVGREFGSEIEIAYWFEEKLGMALPGLEIGSETKSEYESEFQDDYPAREKYLLCTFGKYVVPGFYDARFILEYEPAGNAYLITNAYWQ